jgi:hypothetical protein
MIKRVRSCHLSKNSEMTIYLFHLWKNSGTKSRPLALAIRWWMPTRCGETPNATHSVTPHSRHSTLKFNTVTDVQHSDLKCNTMTFHLSFYYFWWLRVLVSCTNWLNELPASFGMVNSLPRVLNLCVHCCGQCQRVLAVSLSYMAAHT